MTDASAVVNERRPYKDDSLSKKNKKKDNTNWADGDRFYANNDNNVMDDKNTNTASTIHGPRYK